MSFASPHWLWALLALPVLAWLEARATRADRARTERLVARALWGRVVRRPAEGWRWARLALVLLGGAGLVLALARPQWGIVREKVEREGVDVVLVLDSSGSMATEDVAPNRFFLARAALMSLCARLEGDRFGLVAFEGDAHALVPLTLDADAVGLFLDTLEPGAVPTPGTSLGAGLARALELFVDPERAHKVLVLVSDGEDLEGEVDAAVARAKQAGVVVHAVGVGTEQGQPVPDYDAEGNRAGFKKDESGAPVVSRLHPETLEAVARGTGGRFFRITPTDTGLQALASAIEGMEQRALAREFSYRRKERFQLPLAIGLSVLALGLALPPPARRAATALLVLLAGAPQARAQSGGAVDEMLLRPRRRTDAGIARWGQGNHPAALDSFKDAAALRGHDLAAQFNLADGLYKNGRYDEAAPLFEKLGADPRAPLAAAARYNLGNTLYQKQDYPGAVKAYKGALRLAPHDQDARRNLELALRQLEQQKQQQERQQQKQQPQQDQQQQQKQDQQGQRPKTEEEKEQERFRQETGMPKQRAMQLLEALQQNEKAEQKKQLARARAGRKKTGKDW